MLDFFKFEFTDTAWVLLAITVFMLIIQIVWYVLVFGSGLRIFKKENKHSAQATASNIDNPKGVSIVIVSDNNGEALKEGLLKILEQDYPLFEVIVVDENSSDDTEFILYVLKDNYPHLKVIKLGNNANNFESNKFSLSIGIRSAKFENILITDVCCQCESFDWLSHMMAPINENADKKVVSGITLRTPAKKILLNITEQFHTATSYLNLMGFFRLGNIYTATGNNMIYNKDFLLQNGGFISQYRNNCNQEDHFVHRHCNKHNSAVKVNKDSFLYLPPFESFKDFKRALFATGLSRKMLSCKDKILLAFLPVSTFLFYISIIFLIITQGLWQYCIAFAVIKYTIQIIYYKKGMNRLGIKKYWMLVPLTELYFLLLNSVIHLKVLFFRKKQKKIRWE